MTTEEYRILAKCQTCGTPVELWLADVPKPDIGHEEATEEVDLECSECGESSLMTIRAHLGGLEVFYSDLPTEKATIEHLDYGYDDWLEQMEPEPHPRTIFNLALDEWKNLVRTLADRVDGGAGINRMLFMQLYSIVEAYLSDEIIRLAFDYPEIAAAIVTWNTKLAKEPVTLRMVAENPDIVRERVIASLRRMQYHNFQSVEGLTFVTLGHHILPQGEENRNRRERLVNSVIWRHHCVHRNGRDTDGNMIDAITIDYLEGIAGIMARMVADLSEAVDLYVEAQRLALLDDEDGIPWAREVPLEQKSDRPPGTKPWALRPQTDQK